MRDNDAVPIVRRHFRQKGLPVFARRFILLRHQYLGVRVSLNKLARKLLEHMVWNDIGWLADKTKPLLLHAAGNHCDGIVRHDVIVGHV